MNPEAVFHPPSPNSGAPPIPPPPGPVPCIDLIKQFEGCRLSAYKDSAGVLTIGYGHAGPDVIPGLTWSQLDAELHLEDDVAAAALIVAQMVKVPLTQHQRDALTSLVFNIGAGHFKESTLLRLLNDGLYNRVPDEISRWAYAGGEVLPGLVTRRRAEIALWNAT